MSWVPRQPIGNLPAAVSICGVLLTLSLSSAHAAVYPDSTIRTDYALNCQGCHLEDGRGFPRRGVPSLGGFVSRFTAVPGGRAYLVRVPGVAQSDLSDARLATLLNWMLATFDPTHVPAGFIPYNAKEVGKLRAMPLAHVAELRMRLIQRMAAAPLVANATGNPP